MTGSGFREQPNSTVSIKIETLVFNPRKLSLFGELCVRNPCLLWQVSLVLCVFACSVFLPCGSSADVHMPGVGGEVRGSIAGGIWAAGGRRREQNLRIKRRFFLVLFCGFFFLASGLQISVEEIRTKKEKKRKLWREEASVSVDCRLQGRKRAGILLKGMSFGGFFAFY